MKRESKSLKFKRKGDVKNLSNPEFHKRKWDRSNEVVYAKRVIDDTLSS
jgi:hypothetical protein